MPLTEETGARAIRAEDPSCQSDLELARACLASDEKALASLDRLLTEACLPALRAIDPSPAFTDDIMQQVRVRLLMGTPDDRTPRLATYAGRGPLGGFVRVAALRTAMTAKRDNSREIPLEDGLAQLADSATSPAAAHARADDHEHLRAALRAAIAAQPSRIRAILRLYYGDGAGLEDLAALYHVHASTISRWLDRAREDIFAATRRHLRDLRLGPSTIDAMLADAPALDVSLTSLLRTV
ncbi:MAG TPA: hypothetical protein VL463_27885 [Kofleriaceae bacterium]|nr:hypothetical protein [Kofleriaceae bacterium]